MNKSVEIKEVHKCKRYDIEMCKEHKGMEHFTYFIIPSNHQLFSLSHYAQRVLSRVRWCQHNMQQQHHYQQWPIIRFAFINFHSKVTNGESTMRGRKNPILCKFTCKNTKPQTQKTINQVIIYGIIHSIPFRHTLMVVP